MPGFRFGLRINVSFDFNTMLIVYDRFGPLGYTTNLLKNCGLASIGPSYDQDTKMRTFISILENCNRLSIYTRSLRSLLASAEL
jgi:hypothetical protein